MKLLTFSPNGQNSPRRIKSRKGFSIVEVAIAMGVVTLLLTTFLGVFGPAQKNIQRALSTKDANRLKDTLSNEMSVLRIGETNASGAKLTSSFEKAYNMIVDSHNSEKAVIMYQYRANPLGDSDGDGILDAFAGVDGIQGKDYIIQTAVRTLGSSDTIEDELTAVDGPVFAVRMTQLIQDPSSGVMQIVSDPQKIFHIKNNAVTSAADFNDYNSAVIAFRAEFFRLGVNKYNFITSSNWDFEKVGNAVTEVNMAVRR